MSGDTPEQSSSRLDRIEQILLATTTTLGETVRQQQVNTQAIAQVGARLDAVGARLDQVGERLDQLTVRVDGLTSSVESLNEDMRLLTDYFTQVITNAETDRERFQREIQRIWEYLLQQGGNGHNKGM
jgi:uncharacterized protein YoxC